LDREQHGHTKSSSPLISLLPDGHTKSSSPLISLLPDESSLGHQSKQRRMRERFVGDRFRESLLFSRLNDVLDGRQQHVESRPTLIELRVRLRSARSLISDFHRMSAFRHVGQRCGKPTSIRSFPRRRLHSRTHRTKPNLRRLYPSTYSPVAGAVADSREVIIAAGRVPVRCQCLRNIYGHTVARIGCIEGDLRPCLARIGCITGDRLGNLHRWLHVASFEPRPRVHA
jgi:hypothetical protein